MQIHLPGLTQRETDIIQELTTRIVNKLLHIPMLRLKETAVEGQEHIYTEALQYLFDLKEQPDETHNHWDTSKQAGYDTDTMGGRAAASTRARNRDNTQANSDDR